MKWGYATTAAIVRSLQKDYFYRQQIESDLKHVLLDHLSVGWYLKLEEWLPFIVDIFYYSTLTGSGKRTLGESYSNIVPVESVQRKLLLGIRSKRILWVILGVLIPHILKRKTKNKMSGKIIEILSESRLILFYLFGKFPSFTNRILSIRYIFYPRRPPVLDEDSLIYKGLALALSIVTISKLKSFFYQESEIVQGPSPSYRSKFKCPVCLDLIDSVAFSSIKCGHVYCWHCIAKWMQTEDTAGSCPVCRVACDPPDLLPLANLI